MTLLAISLPTLLLFEEILERPLIEGARERGGVPWAESPEGVEEMEEERRDENRRERDGVSSLKEGLFVVVSLKWSSGGLSEFEWSMWDRRG